MKLNFLDCWKRRKDLPAFESGELPPERAEALAAHLAVCERCRNEWESLVGVAQALRSAPPEPAVPALNLWSRIEAEILEPVPVAPVRASRWKVAALPLGAALACAGVFAATGNLGLLAPRTTLEPTPKAVAAEKKTLEAAAPVPPVVAIVRAVATPEPIYEPIELDPTPAPTPKAPRPKLRRSPAAPRKDPFAPAEKIQAAPHRDVWTTDDEAPEEIPIQAEPPLKDPDVKVLARQEVDPEEVIRVERPTPVRSARRDAAADAEAAERRAADALGSPIDAVARASQPRKLLP